MALELIEIKDFPRTTSVTGSGDELIVVSKADGKTYGIKTSDFKAFLGTVTSIAPRPISPSDPTPTLDGVYKPTVTQNEAGTPIVYGNAGGLSVNTAVGGDDYGKSVELIKNGGSWVKIGEVMPMQDVSGLATKEEIKSKVNISDIRTELLSNQIFNKAKFLRNFYIPISGVVTPISGALTTYPLSFKKETGFISISGLEKNSHRLIFLDENLAYVPDSAFGFSNTVVGLAKPAGAKYVQIYFKHPNETNESIIDTLMVSESQTVLPYEAFKEVLLSINDAKVPTTDLSIYYDKTEVSDLIKKSTPETLYNQILNGNFNNSDQWEKLYTHSELAVNSNQLSVRSSESLSGFQQNIGRPKEGDKLYFSFNFSFPEYVPVSVYMYLRGGYTSGVADNLTTGGGTGQEMFGSKYFTIDTPVSADVFVAIRSASDFGDEITRTSIVAKRFTFINLTEAFGAGREPSKLEMDSFIKILSGSWIDFAISKPSATTGGASLGFSLNNLVDNGDMSKVNLSTGLALGFSKNADVSSTRVENNTQYFSGTISAPSGGIFYNLKYGLEGGSIYYLSAYISNIAVFFVDNSIPTGFNGLYSFQFANTREGHTQIRINPREPNIDASISDLLLINLTEAFGKGNEPSKLEMDRLLKMFPNRWFQGIVPQEIKTFPQMYSELSAKTFSNKYSLKISSIPIKTDDPKEVNEIYPVMFGVKMTNNRNAAKGYQSHAIPTGWLYYTPQAPYDILYASGTPDNPKKIFTWNKSITPTTTLNPDGVSPEFYSPMICKNGDIVFVFRSERSSGINRSNPILYKAEDNYQNPIVIDFGENLKPCSWLQNCGAEFIYDEDCFVFSEYIRPWSGDAHVWKVSYPLENPDNWRVVLTKTQEEIEHLHTTNYDPYSGDIYVTSGDASEECNVWRSSDIGETWDLISHGNAGEARVLNFIFLKDSAYWGTDDGRHFLCKVDRGLDGKLDFSTFQTIDILSYYSRGVTYATVLIDDPFGLLILRHIDAVTYDPIAVTFYDLKSGDTHVLKMMTQIDDGNPPNEYGFRNEAVNFYTSPSTNKVVVGFGYKPNYFDLLGNKKGENIGSLCNMVLEVF